MLRTGVDASKANSAAFVPLTNYVNSVKMHVNIDTGFVTDF